MSSSVCLFFFCFFIPSSSRLSPSAITFIIIARLIIVVVIKALVSQSSQINLYSQINIIYILLGLLCLVGVPFFKDIGSWHYILSSTALPDEFALLLNWVCWGRIDDL